MPKIDEEKRQLMLDLNHAILKIEEMKAEIRQKDQVIKQLRQTLATLGIDSVVKAETEGYNKPQRGRPQIIDDQTRARVKRLKDNGLSVREIAKREGISIGTVSKLIRAPEGAQKPSGG